MKTHSPSRALPGLLLGALLGYFALPAARAYPPAPHHLIYGTVRDELGNPLQGTAGIILETSAGVLVKGGLVSSMEPSVNYHVKVAMDASLTSDLYKPTALRPTVPFKLRIRIGDTTYLPIQMTGNFHSLGRAGQRTRLDLTLGEDLDGDGLPDAWERLIDADITKVSSGGDADGDGLTNIQEYLVGTYAFDPEHSFALNITGVNGGVSQLEFTAIRGRTYTIQGSSDLAQWSAIEFRIPTQSSALQKRYLATDARQLRIEAPPATGGVPLRFFRLVVE